jgi:transcription antitermination protein NusB
MTRRSRAREVALQLLFQLDNHPKPPQAAINDFARHRLREPALVEFCLTLYNGVVAHREDIDKKLASAAENWRVARMPAVDRNILRMGAFEILHRADTPPAVALDECIELARRFGTAESSGFVNGVLDRLRRDATGQPPPSA